MAALFAETACHYIDPQCLATDFGISGRRAHGVLLQLGMSLPHKRYTEWLHVDVNRAGGVEYGESRGAWLTTCRRMSDDDQEAVVRFWSSEALGAPSPPRCGPGYAFSRYRGHACRETWASLRERRRTFGLPSAEIILDSPRDEAVSFGWDMESPLPEDLERAFLGTLGVLCAGNVRLGRHLRRSMPELAAKAGR